MELFDLTGKVAVVTGGNGGIGLGMARGLAQRRRDADGRRAQPGQERRRRERAGGTGREAAAIEADVTQEDDCQSLVDQTVARFGRLDILVDNAGINIRKQPEAYSLDEWRTIIDGNLTSAFLCSRAAYPAMVRAGGGKIINIGSMASVLGLPFAGRTRRARAAWCSSRDRWRRPGPRTISRPTRSCRAGSTPT